MDNADAQIPTTTEGASTAPHPGLMARVIGVLTLSSDTFKAIAANPRWAVVLLLVVLVSSVVPAAFVASTSGRQAAIDAIDRSRDSGLVGTIRSFIGEEGQKAMDEQLDRQRQQILDMAWWRLAWQPALGGLLWPPIAALVLAGVLFFSFKIFGGEATYRQVFTVTVHAGLVIAVRTLFITPINYYRASADSAANLYMFVSGFLPDSGFVAKLLGMVDLFRVWWVLVLAAGLAAVYRRKMKPVAWSLFSVYGLFVLIAAGVAAWLAARSGA